jgi:hypothetical protein
LEQSEPKLPLSGMLQLQVCGQKTCEAAEDVRLSFTLGLLAPDGVRAPEALRHQSKKP